MITRTIKALLTTAYTSLKLCVYNPPKANAFASLPLQSGVFLCRFLSRIKNKVRKKNFFLSFICSVFIGILLRILILNLFKLDYLMTPKQTIFYLFTYIRFIKHIV